MALILVYIVSLKRKQTGKIIYILWRTYSSVHFLWGQRGDKQAELPRPDMDSDDHGE